MRESDGHTQNVSKARLARAVVRKYRLEDRDAVRRICYDTGLMGHPIGPYFGCFELFADYWMNYYTDYEPESAFVAELDGQVIGYLVGCRETSKQQHLHNKIIMRQIRRKFLTFGYKIDRRVFIFLWRFFRSIWRREFVQEPIADYPAHLHMNLIEGYRSGGIGARLLSTFMDYLRENDIKGLHLGTTTYNKLAVLLYKKWGFRFASLRPLTMYEGIIPEKIDLLFFTRDLT